MKKFAPLMLGAALVLSLTGCETFLGGTSSSTSAKKNVASGPQTTHYDCTNGASFSVTRDSKTPNKAILTLNAKQYEMKKVPKASGIDRLEHSSGLTYIGATNMSSLINFKQGKNYGAECRSAEQNAIQKELDAKAKEEKAAKAAKAAQTKQTTPVKKTTTTKAKTAAKKTVKRK